MSPEHQSQLQAFEEYLNNTLGKMVAKYAFRFTWMVILTTFAAAGVYFKLQGDVTELRRATALVNERLDKINATLVATNDATVARVVDWSKWRVLKDAIDDNYERRLAWLETVERTRRP